MKELKIDPKFQSLLPSLSDEEFRQLEENIKADGCRNALVTWQGTIVDGHQRYRICTENNIPFKTREMNFANHEEAMIWILRNQLGVQNLSPEQKNDLLKKLGEPKGKTMILKISEINPGLRARDEYGDMEALAKSIQEHGLLHPIVVDSDYNLIAGCRRLLACERIGLKEIEAKVLEDISERELRILELEENIQRKDLTTLEKSKNLVKLAEMKEQELKEKEYFAESAKKSRGQPPKVNGLKQVSEEIGVPIKTLHDAKQHVKAVEEFPPLENLPKHEAIETAKELRTASPEDQDKILDFAQRRTQTLSVQKEDNFYAYIDECEKVTKAYHKALGALLWIKADEKDFKMLSEIIVPQSAQTYLMNIDDALPKLTRIRNFMKGVVENGKKPKTGV